MTKTIKRIPIRNLYYLFCYAWDRFREASPSFASVEDAPDVPHMLARAICSAVDTITVRGLDRAYLESTDDLRHIRGKIDIGRTATLAATRRGVAGCVFSDLSTDVLSNQLLKATLTNLSHSPDLDLKIRRELAGRLRWFDSVSLIRIDGSLFRRALLHRNNSHYGLALSICELIFQCLLPADTKGTWRFAQIENDEQLMARVFQDFLRNFWRLEQDSYKISADRLSWGASPIGNSQSALVPDLQTDIVLKRQDHVIIADAKYYTTALTHHYGKEKLHSTNLYQIYSYVKMYARAQPTTVHGMLVYPTTSRELDETYSIDGHEFRIRTVNLSKPWQEIAGRLLEIID